MADFYGGCSHGDIAAAVCLGVPSFGTGHCHGDANPMRSQVVVKVIKSS